MKYFEARKVHEKPEGKPRAFLLFSGGLDSLLAGLVLLEAGVDIVPITFKSPFFGYRDSLELAEKMNWPLVVADITEEQLRIVENPKHGYGKNMNPCIDCHAQMIRIACSIKDAYGVDFIATGEVLNERPKSQNRRALEIVAEESGCADMVLRPLSAKLLPPTEPERKGLVDRSKLLDISGRSRRRQFELARKFGVKEFPSPGGGCLLTDSVFSGKLRRLLKWRGSLNVHDIELVKAGRSFFEKDFWIVVPRNEAETRKMEKVALDSDYRITTVEAPGPLTILRFKNEDMRGAVLEEALRKASLLTIRYSKLRDSERASVRIIGPGIEKTESFERSEWQPFLEKPYLPQF